MKSPASLPLAGGGDLEPLTILDESGNARETPMSDQQSKQALRLMLLSRALDDRAVKLQRLGMVGLYGPVLGQEAAIVGSAMALDRVRDWIVPAYREQPAMLLHGLPLQALVAQFMGRSDAARIPDDVNLLPRNQAVGAQLPHATGLAWGLRLRGLDAVVMVYCGEGATSEGDFHEASNVAGLMRAPLIFLVQNNQWAISTPSSKQTAAPSIASRGVGYGFPGHLVDGNDLFAMYKVSVEAVKRARAGLGPTLIEALTYRMSFHNTTDNPREYRDDQAVEAQAKRDPIRRLEMFLTRRRLWSDEEGAAVRAAVMDEVEAAVAAVNALPRPGADSVFEHVYASPQGADLS
jgi:TPP-dependent pyruvate/acetoin dehydrogenase alpha subunit